MAARTILIASGEGIATLTLNRPEARNALDLQMREELGLARAKELASLAQGWMIASEDHREGLAAFFENRAPRFQGR
ncbi:MAG: hypothetical protein HYV61_10430 [Candidatus Rokubacteria bacterium]|nr:hypothetical protein [Candidatus Rokubacteria bacterium]